MSVHLLESGPVEAKVKFNPQSEEKPAISLQALRDTGVVHVFAGGPMERIRIKSLEINPDSSLLASTLNPKRGIQEIEPCPNPSICPAPGPVHRLAA
jgi:hypothetical protein